MEQESPLRYIRLVGETGKYPYVVGLVAFSQPSPGQNTPELEFLGSGILVDSLHVLTCHHVCDSEDPLYKDDRVFVITASDAVEAEVEAVDEEWDLALLRLDREWHTRFPVMADGVLLAQEPLIAVGVQQVVGSTDLTLAEVPLRHKNSNSAGAIVLDLELEGAPRHGYSGGPIIKSQDGTLVWTGLTRRGGKGAGFGSAVGTGNLRAFLGKHLPGHGFASRGEDAHSGLVSKILAYSGKAREGLEPHILTRIRRDVAHEIYLPAIRRGLEKGKKRIVPIIAPAGYGKSTLLGEIYDALVKEGRWVLLLRCNDLIISSRLADELSIRMGEAVSHNAEPLEEIIEKLVAVLGPGELLIDTLDLILNGQQVPAFRRLLMRLTDLGAVVVFTCRDYEYETFLEPASDKLAGLNSIVDRYKVPPFTSKEVVRAARTFIQKRKLSRPPRASFGKKILNLAADDRPLRDLVQNPLLLALMCDLFGETGEVPPDMTVSRLYAIYWEKKITGSRNEKHAPFSAVALKKEQICLQIAEILAARSRLSLVDSMFAADLRLPADETAAEARADLLSEDVLQASPGGKIFFFHQTFLEYAIARRLAMEMGRIQREQLIAELSSVVPAAPLHWWPVVRQLLTIVSDEEFQEIFERLDKTRLEVFRTAVFAAAWRNDPAMLEYLGSQARNFPEEHQWELLKAIDGIPTSLLDTAFHLCTTLLRYGTIKTARKAASIAGNLLIRDRAKLAGMLDESITAIQGRSGKAEDEKYPHAELMGMLLRPLSQTKRKPRGDALKVLRRHYLSLADGHRAYVVRLHHGPAISQAAKHELIRRAITRPLSQTTHPADLRPQMAHLCQETLAGLLPPERFSPDSVVLDALHERLPAGWVSIQTRAVGAVLSQAPEQIGKVVEDLIKSEDKERISRNLGALHHAASLDSVGNMVKVILGLQTRIPAVMLHSLRDLSPALARGLPMSGDGPPMPQHDSGAAGQEKTPLHSAVEAVDRMAAIRHRDELKPAIDRLPTEMLDVCIQEARARLQSQGADKQMQRILLGLYWKAASSEMGARGLIELSLSQYESLATKASLLLAELARSSPWVDAEGLREMARSQFAGVRRNHIEALIGIMDKNGDIPEKDFENLCGIALTEKNPVVITRSFEFAMRWIHKHRRISSRALDAQISSMRYLLKTERMNDGIARALLVIFKVLAQTEDPRLMPGLGVWAEELMASINIGKLNKGGPVATNLLIALERASPGYLAAFAGKCCKMQPGNICSIARAIKKAEGSQSLLLQQMLNAEWCPPEAKTLILSFFRV